MNYYKNDIRHVKGDTYSCALELKDFDQALDSIFFTCRDVQNDDSEILFEAELYDGITVVDYDEETNTRQYAIRIAPSKTEGLQVGTYYYDLQVGINDDIYTIMKGQFIIEQEATKSSTPSPDPEEAIKNALDAINGEVIGTTVTAKLEYLAQTKELIRTALNSFFDTGISTSATLRSYAEEINDLNSQYPTE